MHRLVSSAAALAAASTILALGFGNTNNLAAVESGLIFTGVAAETNVDVTPATRDEVEGFAPNSELEEEKTSGRAYFRGNAKGSASSSLNEVQEEEESVAEGPSLTPEASSDAVHSLPGISDDDFKKLGFNMFAGYINVSTSAEKSRSLFYWFITKEQSSDWSTEATMLWTNGGPGCSGMLGLLTEQGPFRPTKGGEKLVKNPYAWNKLINIVFIEQPVGVGFSRTDQSEVYSDENAADDNRRFIIGFLDRYPALKKNPFFISSESFGGHYMPTLARNILDHPGSVPNFKGLLVGNPYIWAVNNDLAEFETYAGHQIVPGPLVASFMKNLCNQVQIFRFNPKCQVIYQASLVYAQGLDPYGIDFPVCSAQVSALQGMRRRDQKAHFEALLNQDFSKDPELDAHLEELEKTMGPRAEFERRRSLQYFPDSYQECEEDYASAYLNREDVQKALHAIKPAIGSWMQCSDAVTYSYSEKSRLANMIPIFESLMGKGLHLTIFSGDDDAVCGTAGLQHWIWNYHVSTAWSQWFIKDKKGQDQVAGYHVGISLTENSSDDINIYTVHGAGHMVPSTRPYAALEILSLYLDKALGKQ